MIKVGICGARGRMGIMNSDAVCDEEGLILGAGLEHKSHPDIGKSLSNWHNTNEEAIVYSDIEKFVSSCDAIIDFTAPSVSLSVLKVAAEKKVSYILGTTGFSEEEKKLIEEYSKKTPVLFASNMSVGVNVLFALVEKAASLLGPSYEVEIVETHHNKKKDSPSGTALTLAETVAKEFGISLQENAVYGREGQVGERRKAEIGIHAVRASDIVGEHTVMFCSEGERIELIHKSHSRKGYAKGSVRGVKFLANKENGLYSVRDMLGI